MRTDYPTVIRESVDELATLERRLRGRPVAVRVRMLRLLKSGAATTLGACVLLLGYSPRQLARWCSSQPPASVRRRIADEPRRPASTTIWSNRSISRCCDRCWRVLHEQAAQ